MPRRQSHGRKLLVATLGVAAVSYGCRGGNPPEPVGNLVAAPPPPPAAVEGGAGAAGDAGASGVLAPPGPSSSTR